MLFSTQKMQNSISQRHAHVMLCHQTRSPVFGRCVRPVFERRCSCFPNCQRHLQTKLRKKKRDGTNLTFITILGSVRSVLRGLRFRTTYVLFAGNNQEVLKNYWSWNYASKGKGGIVLADALCVGEFPSMK